MTTAIPLILLGVLTRLIPHPPNAVAMGALALFAGARLPRRWAWIVPLLAMALSDLVLDRGSLVAFGTVTRWTSYATFALIVGLGRFGRAARPVALGALAVGGSTLFYLTTNFAVWATGTMYPHTTGGLLACYVAAWPFYRNAMAADLAGTVALFGLDALARRGLDAWAARRRARLAGGAG